LKSRHKLLLSFVLMAIGIATLSSMVVVVFSQGGLGPLQAHQAAIASEKGLFLIGAGIAAGLASCGAGIGLGTASAAAIGAIAEKPEMLGRTLLFVVLIEAIAIYGLAMFFIIYSRI
jgi:V/A-type H+-transporting ATPase subunit K